MKFSLSEQISADVTMQSVGKFFLRFTDLVLGSKLRSRSANRIICEVCYYAFMRPMIAVYVIKSHSDHKLKTGNIT
ncbi:hypothetical protein [Anaplasma phagocytophilum]|uniref:hypothetical protein n=1 Tax=Anaplasma phagocytophilum TaxID=948 RepID=UPI000A9B3498|nr:hypothetical protein [Anaplasma phagocytophilum]